MTEKTSSSRSDRNIRVRSRLLVSGASLAAALASMAPSDARAEDRHWDANGTAVGSGGTGTWNLSNLNWSPNGDGVSGPFVEPWNNPDLDNAIFGGTAGTVTIGAPVTTGNITFASAGYILNGGTLTLGGPSSTITTNAGNTTINSVVAGSNGLIKAGAGGLILNGSNSFTGGISLNLGSIYAANDAALGALSNNIVTAAGAQVRLSIGGVSTSRSVTIGSGGTLILEGSGAGSALISGDGRVSVAASGVTMSNDASTYTGQTIFSGCNGVCSARFTSLRNLGEASSLGAPATVIDGTIVFNQQSQYSDSLIYLGDGDSSNRNWDINGNNAIIRNQGTGTLSITGDIDVSTGGTFMAETANVELLGVLTGGAFAFNGVSGNTVTLGGANTFTGQATIAGLVRASVLADTGTASSLGAGSTIGLSVGTLSYTGTGNSSNRSWIVAGANAISNDGTGALALSGNAAFAPGGAVDSLTLGGSFTGESQFSGVISGAGGVLSNGSGTWVLGGANTFVGNVTVTSGTLKAGGASAFGVSNGLVVNGGTLDLGGFDLIAPSLTGTGGTVALGAQTLTVDAKTAQVYGGSITGSGGLRKAGAGSLTLTGANSYTGATTVGGGRLTLDFSGAGGPADNIVSASSSLVLSGGTLEVVGAAGETNDQSFNGLTVNAGSNTVRAVSGTGGTVNLNLGAITRAGGLVNFVLPTTGAITTSNADGVLGGWATINGSDYAKVVGGGILAFDASDYTTKDDAGTWANGDIISDTAGAANSAFFGNVTGNVQLGGLRYTAAAGSTVTIGAGSILGVDGTIIVAPSTLATNQNINGGSLTGSAGGGTLGVQHNGTGTLTIGSTIVDNGGVTGFAKSGGGTVRLTGGNTYSGGTILSGGRLEVAELANGGVASSIGASSADAANLVLESGTLAYTGGVDAVTDRGMTLVNGGADRAIQVDAGRTVEFSGLVTSSDDAGLTKTGSGTLVLSNAANDYVGVTTITHASSGASTLSVNTLSNGGVASGIGAASSDSVNLVMSNGGRLQYTGGTTVVDRGFTLANGQGGIDVANAATTLTISGIATGAGTFVKHGAGTLILSGNNTYTGETVIDAGTLRAGSVNAFGPGGRYMTVNSGATLELGGFNINTAAVIGGGVIDLGANTLTTAGGPGVFTGRITGTGGYTRGGGSYTQTMSGCTNDYTGATTISSGLAIDCIANGGQASGLGASSAASSNLVFAGGTLAYTGVTATTDRGFALTGNAAINVVDAGTTLGFSGAITGGGQLAKTGDGTLLLSGTNSSTGNLRVIGGTVRLGSTSALGTGGASLDNTAGVLLDMDGFSNSVLNLTGGGTLGGNIALGGATLTITNGGSGAATYGGAISGSGGLVKTGGAFQQLTGCSSSYSGTTVINQGILSVSCLSDGGANSSIGSSSAAASSLVLSGGTLQYVGTGGSTDRQFTLSASATNKLDASGTGAITFTHAGPLTFSSANTAQTLTLGGTSTANNVLAAQVINNGTGVTRLTKTDAGTWILTNPASTYTGITTISGGVLGVDKLADGGVASSIGMSSAAASNLVIGNGSTLRYTGAGDTTNRLFTLSSGVTFIESSGTGAIVFTDTGPVTLASNNQARTIALGGTNTGNNTLAGSIGNAGTGVTTLAKNDSGTWVLTGNHTYTGSTNINGGLLSIGGGGTTGAIASALVNNFGTLAFDRSDDVAYGGTIVGTGGLFQNGSGATILTGTNSYTGGTTINAGTLQLGNGGTTGSILGNVVNDGVFAFNRSDDLTFAGLISGSGALRQTGPGVLALTGVNTYAGGTTISGASTLQIESDANLGDAAGDITFDSGTLRLINSITSGRDINLDGAGTFDSVNGSEWTVTGDITGPGSLTVNGLGGALIIAGDATHGGGTTVNTGSSLKVGDSGTTGTLAGDILNNGFVAFDRSDSYAYAGTISGSGSVSTQGGGVITLTANSTYGGNTTVTGASELLINAGNTITSGGSTSVESGMLTVTDDSTFVTTQSLSVGSLLSETGVLTVANGGRVSAGTGLTIAATSAGSTGTVNVGAAAGSMAAAAGFIDGAIIFGPGTGTLNFNHTGTNHVFGNDISGLGTINQIAGVTNLTGNSAAFAGTTNVTGGTLRVNGTLGNASSTVNVDTGGILGGAGTIGGSVAITDGRLSPGNSPGTLEILGNLSLTSASQLDFEFGEAGVVGGALNDLVNVGGDLVLDGTINVTVPAGGSFGGGIYRVFNYGGALTDNGLDLGVMPGGSSVTVQTSVLGQVNLINSSGLALNFWDGAAGPKFNDVIDGGNGVWELGGTDNNWADATGGINSGYADGTFAVFAGTGGTVTIDNGNGTVTASGMQFASDGYVIDGAPLTLTGPDSTIRVGDGTAAGADFTATIAADITGSTRLTKTDAGTLVLTGTNSYTGGTLISGGVLSVANDSFLGNVTGAVTLDGGTLQMTGASAPNLRTFNLGVNGGGIDIANAAASFGVLNALTGAGGLTKLGAGSLTLSGENTYIGGTTIQAGTLQIGGLSGTTGSIVGDVLNNASLVFNRSNAYTYAGSITGTGSVSVVGTGVTTLTGNSIYGGGTLINGTGGELRIVGGANVTSGGGTTMGRSTLSIDGANSVFSTASIGGNIAFAGSTVLNVTDGGTLRVRTGDIDLRTTTATTRINITGANSLADVAGGIRGSATFNAPFELTVAAGGTLLTGGASQIGTAASNTNPIAVSITGAGSNWTSTGSLLMTAGDFTIDQGGTASFASATFGAAPQDASLSVSGAGSSFATTGNLTIAQDAGGTGTVTIGDGGLLRIDGGTLAMGLGDATLNIGAVGLIPGTASAGTLDADEITFAAATSNRVNFNHVDTDYVFSTRMSGLGDVYSSGTGTTILTADNAYTGQTYVNFGTLIVNGDQSAATGQVDVNAAGTLGGMGVIGGNVSAGGRLTPGDLGAAPGTLTINGDLSLFSSTNLDYSFGQANVPGGAFNDLIEVGGDLTLDGTLNVAITPGGSFDPGVYRVINYGGTLIDNGLDVDPAYYVQTSVANQVNLVNTTGLTMRFWDGAAGVRNDGVITGGNGLWQASGGNDNWTEFDGSANAPFTDEAFAVFSGVGGTVTVDASLGPVTAAGMQFASDGYVFQGADLVLVAPQSIIRVGDGTTGGAAYTATISSNLTGFGDVIKSDLGTLVLTGTNAVAGETNVRGGELRLTDGGTLNNANGVIGRESGEQGIVTVAGTDGSGNASTWTNSGILRVGGLGTGTLNILDGGLVTVADIAYVGDDVGSQGIVTVSGQDANGNASTWTGASDIVIGEFGNGTLNITDGGQVGNESGWIGSNVGSVGIVNVTGVGANGTASTWTNSGDVLVGYDGTGTLNIVDGGKVVSVGGQIGANSDGVGEVLVTGVGSLWENSGRINVGLSGAGTLRIENGAEVTSNDGIVGVSAQGEAIVSGAGTSWINTQQLNIGSFGAGTLRIEDGASVTSNQGYIGANATGGVVVTGAGSNWSVTDFSMTVGNEGTGSLLVEDGGLVRAEGGFALGVAAGSSGTVTIAGTAGSRGVIETSQIGGGLGTVSFSLDGGVLRATQDMDDFFVGFDARDLILGANGGIVDTDGHDIGISPRFAGAGGLSKDGLGTLTLTGANSYSGATQVNAGTLIVNGDQSAATGPMTVFSGARLGGAGTIGGNVDMLDGSTLAPGGSVGTLTVNGNLSLAGGSILDYDFGQANVAGGALNDLVNVGGDLTLDGTINVVVPSGGSFDAGVYRVFNYGGALINNGLTLGTMPAGANVGVQTSVAGQVNLVNLAGLTLNFWDGAAGPKNNSAVDGGTGVWQNGTGNENWTEMSGAVNAAYSDGAFAVFSGAAGTVTVDNGLGQVSAAGMQFASDGYVITGDGIELTAPQATIRVGDGSTQGAGYVATIDTVLGGNAEVIKTDAGTLVLSGANTYASGTTINGGTVRISNDANLGASTGVVTLDGGTLATSADLVSARDIVIAGAGTIATADGTTFGFDGVFSGGGALTKAGAGTLSILGENSGFGGSTAVTAGTLSVQASLGGTVTVGAAGRLEGNGSVGGIANAGVVAPGMSIGMLTVAGNYAGNGGALEIEAELGGDMSAADRLVINGATSGTTTVNVINRGGLGAQTVEGIKIVDVAGASDGTFVLNGDYEFQGQETVVVGAYGYRLYKNGVATPQDGDWYLRSALLDGPDAPEVPLYQPGVPVYEAYVGALQSLNRLPTLQQRVGSRSWAASGIWGRFEAERQRPEAIFSTTGANRSVNQWQAQIGFDTLLAKRSDGAALVGGLTAHYGEADGSVASIFGNGSIDAKGYGVGATLTWYGPKGFYVDGQAKLSWFDSDLESNLLGSLVKGNKGDGRAFSLEVGKQAQIGRKLSITPQIQMSYATVDFDRFLDASGAAVSTARGESLKTRWGVSIDHQSQWQAQSGDTRRSRVYTVVNLSYEWLDGAEADVSGVSIVNRDRRLSGELGLGGSYSWGDDRYTLYAEASGDTTLADFGAGYSLKGTAGFRVRF